MPPFLLALRAGFTFLTRIPVGGFPYPPKTWAWITIWFPFIGLFLGGLQALIWMGLTDLSDPSRVIIAVGFGVLITGGFHEDGLSDSVDALGGAYDRDNVLRILKDSRIGAFGALALIFAIGLKVSLLVELGAMAPIGFLLGQSLSRALPVIQLGIQPYARRDDAKSKSRDVASSGIIQAIVAGLWAIAICIIGYQLGVSLDALARAIGAMILTGLIFGIYVQRRVGGLTGDFLGAIQQISEIGILIALATT